MEDNSREAGGPVNHTKRPLPSLSRSAEECKTERRRAVGPPFVPPPGAWERGARASFGLAPPHNLDRRDERIVLEAQRRVDLVDALDELGERRALVEGQFLARVLAVAVDAALHPAAARVPLVDAVVR